MMPVAIASSELTTGERCEYLLGVIACAMTGKRPADLFPWTKAGVADLFKELGRGS
jgi:hypothetical protein